MTHDTLARLTENLKRAARVKRALKRAGITQDRLADEAGVTRTMVCHWLAGRTTSSNLHRTARRLIVEAKAVTRAGSNGAAA